MAPSSSDRIEKQVLLRAPITRVWRALADAKEFGSWFGVNMEGDFAVGASVTGRVTHEKYSHLTMAVTIERMEPPRLLSWRWHPAAIESGIDYSAEPTTLVVFELHEVEGGTLLKVIESGFDRLPPQRREFAFRCNTEGWITQTQAIERHLHEL